MAVGGWWRLASVVPPGLAILRHLRVPWGSLSLFQRCPCCSTASHANTTPTRTHTRTHAHGRTCAHTRAHARARTHTHVGGWWSFGAVLNKKNFGGVRNDIPGPAHCRPQRIGGPALKGKARLLWARPHCSEWVRMGTPGAQHAGAGVRGAAQAQGCVYVCGYVGIRLWGRIDLRDLRRVHHLYGARATSCSIFATSLANLNRDLPRASGEFHDFGQFFCQICSWA